MKKPNVLVYSFNDSELDCLDIYLSVHARSMDVKLYTEEQGAPIGRFSIGQARELAHGILDAIAYLFPDGYPISPKEDPQIISDTPAPTVSERETEPVSLPRTEDDPMHDDPFFGYLLRHEYKDKYFTPHAMLNERKECDGPRDSANIFATRYAALRFQQGMKHPITTEKVSVHWIVGFKESENVKLHYYDGTAEGTSLRSRATRMPLSQALIVCNQSIPPQFISHVERVLA